MKKINEESLLDSGEYKIGISQTLTSILSKVKSVETEATVASVFENELYFFIKKFFGKEIIFEKEVSKNNLRHRFKGRLDAISNDLIIEYKKKSKLVSQIDQESATQQVCEYITQIKEATKNNSQAVLTDGQKVRYFYFQDNDLRYTPFKSIDTDDINKIVCYLINVGHKKFVPQNIVSDFKLTSASAATKKLAECLFKGITQNFTEKTRMLFQEWQELFHLSENDRGQNFDIVNRRKVLGELFNTNINNTELDYMALFSLQTTYAIIVKLIACKVVSKLAFNNDIMYFSDLSEVNSNKLRKFVESLEDGYVFATGGIRNLLEGDFFSWYCAKEQWNDELFKALKKMIETLEDYSNYSIIQEYSVVDIFKDLYIEIMPNEVRHSLGEYFTPAWLSDYVVQQSIDMIKKEKWKAVDPCCGSGIFIMSLIKRIVKNIDVFSLTSQEKKDLLNEVLSRVQGVDINPLSVLTARVTYLLAISPLLENQKIEIPIYLGDSANIPQKILVNDIECFVYIIATKQGNINVTLPCSFVQSTSFLEKMSLLQTTIKAEDAELVLSKLISNIGVENLNDEIKSLLKELSEKLVELHENNWDGIWIRIVTNFMLVGRINSLDIVVGNPPWVKWEFLPQIYANKIKDLCLDRHLFSGQTYMGAISLNICALISNVTASTWLVKDGVLAFLMPKTLMTQDSYAGFRNFYTNVKTGERMFLQKIDDWAKSGNPFVVTQEKFLTYYYQYKEVDYSIGTPINFIKKKNNITIKEINYYNNFCDVKKHFEFSKGFARQLDPNRTGFTLEESENESIFKEIIGTSSYKARSGVEFTPAEVYFVEPIKQSGSKQSYMFKNSQFKNAKHKLKLGNEFELETNYIRPVIKSPSIREFGIEESNNYCIFPYDDSNTNSVSLHKLNEKNEYLANYLINNKKLIQGQSKRSLMISKGNDFYALSKVGTYTFAKHLVAFRDNTKMLASVISEVNLPWGNKKMPICAKHSPFISMDNDNNFITEDEAYYLAGILNTSIVQDYFRKTFDGRSFSIDFNIKLPKYNKQITEHYKIVELSKKAHANFQNEELIKTLKNNIQKLYLAICKSIQKV